MGQSIQHAVGGVRNPSYGSLTDRLDGVVKDALTQGRIVGTSIMVIRDGIQIYSCTGGLKDRERELPIHANLQYRMASLTKLVTSILCLIAVEKSVISLDDSVAKWLPAFKPKLSGEAPEITIGNLLSHTSGLGYPFFDESGAYEHCGVSNGLDGPGVTLEEELNRLTNAGLLFEPGSKWLYSLSIDVAGAALEKATGMTLGAIFDEYIGKPLKLRSVGFTISDDANLAKPYVRLPDGQLVAMEPHHKVDFPGPFTIEMCPARHQNKDSFQAGGAGLISSIEDFSTILEAIRNGKLGLSSERAKMNVFQDHLRGLPTMVGDGWGHSMAAAVLLEPESAGLKLPRGTIMWSGAYGHSWLIDPVNRVTMVIMTNTTPEGDWGVFPCAFRDALYEELAS